MENANSPVRKDVRWIRKRNGAGSGISKNKKCMARQRRANLRKSQTLIAYLLDRQLLVLLGALTAIG